jgi:hypothetical protein
VLQWTMRLTMNQKITGTVNTLTVWVTNCMDTVNTLSVPIQYTFYPPLSSPLPFSSPSSPTHRYKVKIYRNLKGTKYSSQVHKILTIYAPVIYTRPCIMFWRRGYTLCGEVGRCWALEFPSFLGPVKWQRADRRVPFGAQKTREFQGPTPSNFPK